MSEAKYDSCLFGIGPDIHLFSPQFIRTRKVVTRPAAVTTIIKAGLFEDGKTMILDSCLDGKVRRNLTDEVVFSFDKPVISIVDIERERCKLSTNHAGIFSGKKSVMLFLLGDSDKYYFVNTEGEQLFCIEEYCYPQVLQSGGQIYWSDGYGNIYRDLKKDKPERSISGQNLTMLPFQWENFLITGHHNDELYPEGAVVSTRDKRVVASWNPNNFGYPAIGGVFDHKSIQHLLLVNYASGHNMFIVCQMRTCPADSQKPGIEVIDYIKTDSGHCNNLNPFLAGSSDSIDKLARR